MKTPFPYILPTPFFKFYRTYIPLLPCHIQPISPLFFLLSCFFGWMGDHATFDVLFYLRIIWIWTCRGLILSTRWTLMCVLCNKASSLMRCDTERDILPVLWFDITHKNTHTHTHTHKHHTQGPVDWRNHIIYIYATCYVPAGATFITLTD